MTEVGFESTDGVLEELMKPAPQTSVLPWNNLRGRIGVLFFGALWIGSFGYWLHFTALIILDAVSISLLSANPWLGSIVLIALRVLFLIAAQMLSRVVSEGRLVLRKEPSFKNAGLSLMLVAAVVPLTAYRVNTTAPTVRECRPVLKAIEDHVDGFTRQTFDCLFIGEVPSDRRLSDFVAVSINSAIEFLSQNFQGFFDSIAFTVRTVLYSLEALFIGTPWPIMFCVLIAISAGTAGWRVGLFTGTALSYLALFGFWSSAMSTLVLVGAATVISISLGVPFGIWCAKNRSVYSLVRPVLDIMQTIPSFVYLIPAIAFFSIGKTPGVLATVIYSSPIMIRLTALGIQQVPATVKEAALAFGSTPMQLLLKVEMPLALPSLMTGINQTIMMSLSMSVAAALIGAGGLGYDVLFALQNVEPGRGLLAGLAIAVCAMIIDRTIQGSRKPIPGGV